MIQARPRKLPGGVSLPPECPQQQTALCKCPGDPALARNIIRLCYRPQGLRPVVYRRHILVYIASDSHIYRLYKSIWYQTSSNCIVCEDENAGCMWEAVRAPTTTTAADVLSSRSLVITERNRGVVPRGSYTVMDAGCASVAAHFVSPRLVACLPSHLMQHTACSMAGIYPCRRLGEGGMHRPAQLPAIYYPAPTRRAALLLTMSSDDTAGFLSDLTAAYHDNLSIVSITALLLYDWATTLPTDQDVVWSRKMNVASVLYILARVCGPLYYLSTIVLLGYVDDTVQCKALVYVQDISALLPYAVWAVFSTYRGYALSGRTRYVAAIIFTLTLVPIGVNIYNFVCTLPINYPPPTGCITNIAISDATLTIVIISEGIIIACTWKCTGLRFRYTSKTGGTPTFSSTGNLKSFREVLFENGSLFFLVLFLFNTVCLILTQVGPLAIRGIISYIRDAATPLLIARFLLNLLALRQPSNESADAIDLFSTDVSGGFTASDVVESFVYPDQDGSANMARRSAGSLHFV